jgi:hypothetical protein
MADADLPLAEVLGWYRGSTAGGCAPLRENELSAAAERDLSAPGGAVRAGECACGPDRVKAKQQNSKTAKQQSSQTATDGDVDGEREMRVAL